MKQIKTNMVRRIMICLIGMFIMSLGISLSTRSGLGISPLNAVSFVISEWKGIPMGYVTMGMYFVYIAIEAIIKGKEFQAKDLFQVVLAVLFGYFVNFTKGMLGGITPTNYILCLFITCLSAFLIACGTTVYVSAGLIPQATEGLILAICEQWHLKFSNVKNGMDIVSVLVAVLISFCAMHAVIGVREGTILTAVLVGRIIACLKPLQDWITNSLKEEMQ